MIKQNTAKNLAIFMTDGTDHITGKTGLTLTVAVSKDGAAFATITPTVTELSNGWYSLALTSAHTNTVGDFALHITAAAADPTDLREYVVVDLPGASVSNVTGNVAGSVASVVGNIGGNVVGTVASVVGAVGSVTGAVGSVTGNVGGNVVGSVASVASSVTVGTNNDKAGYALSPAGVQAIWDALTSALTTVGSIGKLIVTNLDALISSRATQSSVNAIPTTPLLQSDSRVSYLDVAISSRLSSLGYSAPDNVGIATIRSKTDNLPAIPASQSDVTTVGTSVSALSTKIGTPYGASIAADIAEIAAETDGISAIPTNPLLTTDSRLANLDATISSRLASSSYVGPDNADILAIKAKTDNLPSDPASEFLLAAAISTRLAATSYVAPDNASIAAIKTKTDNLPLTPAGQNLKKNVPLPGFQFIMLDATTQLPATGFTVSGQRSIDGGAFSNCTNPVVELSGGWYKIDLSAADLNGSVIAFAFIATGALETLMTVTTEA